MDDEQDDNTEEDEAEEDEAAEEQEEEPSAELEDEDEQSVQEPETERTTERQEQNQMSDTHDKVHYDSHFALRKETSTTRHFFPEVAVENDIAPDGSTVEVAFHPGPHFTVSEQTIGKTVDGNAGTFTNFRFQVSVDTFNDTNADNGRTTQGSLFVKVADAEALHFPITLTVGSV